MSTNRVFPGEIVKVKLPYSEVCMHMRVAGKVMWVQLRGVSTQAVARRLLRSCIRKRAVSSFRSLLRYSPAKRGCIRSAVWAVSFVLLRVAKRSNT